MTAYYVQHQGDYINKLVAFTGAKEGITPAPDRIEGAERWKELE